MKSPLKRIGGKAASAQRIVAAFPHPSMYDTYVEPCGGAAHVLMNKPRFDHDEVFNDLEDNLVAFWRVMQTDAAQLQAEIDALPYARSLYYEFYRSLFNGSDLIPFERAKRYFYVLRSTGTGWMRKSPVGWDHRPENLRKFRNALEVFAAVQERFRDVVIDNRDVLATIERYAPSSSVQSPQRVFLYIDPPYIPRDAQRAA